MEQQDIPYRIKQLELALMIVAIGLAFSIFYIFWSKDHTTGYDDRILREQIDSMRAHDIYRDNVIASIQQQRTIDSSRMSGIKEQFQDIPNMITRINNRYNDKRNHITALTDDQQLELLSDNLSQDTGN